MLILLCGDVSSNPGPVSFRMLNCRSIRNKGPLIGAVVDEHCFDVLAVAETHIRPTESNSLLHSVTLTGFNLHHKPRQHSRGGGVGFLGGSSILKPNP